MTVSPSLALQRFLGDILTDDPAVTALVVAHSGLPETFPCIVIGDDQEIPVGEINRRVFEVFSTIHIWCAEPGMTQAKELASAVRAAIPNAMFAPREAHGVSLRDMRFESARYMRDPGGKLSHGVVTIRSVVEITP